MTLRKGTAIAGANGDRRFTVNGRTWRARVQVKDEIPAVALPGEAQAAPAVSSVVLSVALVDTNDSVIPDANGRLQIFEPVVITFQREFMERENADPAAFILDHVNKAIASAEVQLASKAKLEEALKAWNARSAPPVTTGENNQP